MIRSIKIYWLPVVVMFVIFFDELFNCTAIVRGFTVDTGMKQYEAILLAAIGYSMLVYDMQHGNIKKREHRSLVVLFAILFLYMITPLFYGGSNEKHTTYLLVYGSECIPAAIIGMRIAKSTNFNKLIELLPFTVIPISLLIGTIGVAAAMVGKTVGANSYQEGGESGLNYQTLSYFMAFSYTYAFYYTFYSDQKRGFINKILKSAMAVDMLFCAAVCLIGGGRGAFVYIVAITLFMMFYYLKSSKKHRVHAILIIAIFVLVGIYVFLSMGIMQSAGMGRVTGRLTEDNERLELYWSAFDVFISSPIWGGGIGSIWWTVGFFCHNMILDLLAETGLVGTIFLFSIIWRTILKLYRFSNIEKYYLFIFFVFSGELTSYLFSGYYIAAFKIYFVCAFVYCLPRSPQSRPVVLNNNFDNENLTTR